MYSVRLGSQIKFVDLFFIEQCLWIVSQWGIHRMRFRDLPKVSSFEMIFENERHARTHMFIERAVYVPRNANIFLLLTDPEMKKTMVIKQPLDPHSGGSTVKGALAQIQVDLFEVNSQNPDQVFLVHLNEVYRMDLPRLKEFPKNPLLRALRDIDDAIEDLDNLKPNPGQFDPRDFQKRDIATKYPKVKDALELDLEMPRSGPSQENDLRISILKLLFQLEGLKLMKSVAQAQEVFDVDKLDFLFEGISIPFLSRDRVGKVITFARDSFEVNKFLQIEIFGTIVCLNIFEKLIDLYQQKEDPRIFEQLITGQGPELDFVWTEEFKRIVNNRFQKKDLLAYLVQKKDAYFLRARNLSTSNMSEKHKAIFRQASDILNQPDTSPKQKLGRLEEVNKGQLTVLKNIIGNARMTEAKKLEHIRTVISNKQESLKGLRQNLERELSVTKKRGKSSQIPTNPKDTKRNLTKVFSSPEPSIRFFKFDSSMEHFFTNAGEIINKYLLESTKKVSKYSTKTDTEAIWMDPGSSLMVW